MSEPVTHRIPQQLEIARPARHVHVAQAAAKDAKDVFIVYVVV